MGGKDGTVGSMMLVARGLRRPSLSALLQDQHSPRSCHECCLVPSTAAGCCQGRRNTPSPEKTMEGVGCVGTARDLSK